jgi:hypothetical protein
VIETDPLRRSRWLLCLIVPSVLVKGIWVAFPDVGVAIVIPEDGVPRRAHELRMVTVTASPHLVMVVHLQRIVHIERDQSFAARQWTPKMNQPPFGGEREVMRFYDGVAQCPQGYCQVAIYPRS